MHKYQFSSLVRDVMRGREIGNNRIQSVSAWIAYFVLALTDMSLGSCWIGSIQIAHTLVRDALSIPKHYDLVAAIAIGWPETNFPANNLSFPSERIEWTNCNPNP